MACEYRDLPVGYKICRSFSFFFNMFFMTGIGRDDRCHSYCKRNSKRETRDSVPAQEQEPGITTRPPGLRGTARAEWTEGQAGVRLYGKWRGRERKDRVYQSAGSMGQQVSCQPLAHPDRTHKYLYSQYPYVDNMILPMNDKQFAFWKMRRSGTPNITIANLLGISRQAVSKAVLVMDGKIESALREMAQANQIAIEKINSERGILLGRSIPFKTAAIVFVSEKHGMQVWYEHDGDCGSCQRYTECIELLWDYANELGLTIEKTADPTTMAEELFEKVKAIV